MADPIPYSISYSFSGWQSANPSKPLPAPRVDDELANIQTSLASIIGAVKDVRRSDGKLKNGIVDLNSLSSGLSTGFMLRGVWTAGKSYIVADSVVYGTIVYRCNVANTSTSANRPDLDGTTWSALFSVSDMSGAMSAAVYDPTGILSDAFNRANHYGTVTPSDGTVTTAKIVDGAVSADKIADGAVGTTKIADGSVAAAKIADGAVGTTKIADASVTAAKLPVATDRVPIAAIRRRLRAMPDLGDYGITSSGVTNYGQSDFNAMITALKAEGSNRKILVPAGNYRLSQQITIADGIIFEGESQSASVFKFYHTNSAFVFTGANENGGALKTLSIVNDVNALAIAYVQFVAAVGGTAPDFFKIEDVNMTCFGSGTIQYGVVVDGNARNGSAPNGLHGIRNFKVSGLDIFNCTVANMDLRNARSPKIHHLSNYQAGGTLTKLIVGGADATRATSNLEISGSTLGDVSIGFASKVIAAGCDINNVTMASGSSSCRLGTVFGSVANAGSGNAWTT